MQLNNNSNIFALNDQLSEVPVVQRLCCR